MPHSSRRTTRKTTKTSKSRGAPDNAGRLDAEPLALFTPVSHPWPATLTVPRTGGSAQSSHIFQFKALSALPHPSTLVAQSEEHALLNEEAQDSTLESLDRRLHYKSSDAHLIFSLPSNLNCAPSSAPSVKFLHFDPHRHSFSPSLPTPSPFIGDAASTSLETAQPQSPSPGYQCIPLSTSVQNGADCLMRLFNAEQECIDPSSRSRSEAEQRSSKDHIKALEEETQKLMAGWEAERRHLMEELACANKVAAPNRDEERLVEMREFRRLLEVVELERATERKKWEEEEESSAVQRKKLETEIHALEQEQCTWSDSEQLELQGEVAAAHLVWGPERRQLEFVVRELKLEIHRLQIKCKSETSKASTAEATLSSVRLEVATVCSKNTELREKISELEQDLRSHTSVAEATEDRLRLQRDAAVQKAEALVAELAKSHNERLAAEEGMSALKLEKKEVEERFKVVEDERLAEVLECGNGIQKLRDMFAAMKDELQSALENERKGTGEVEQLKERIASKEQVMTLQEPGMDETTTLLADSRTAEHEALISVVQQSDELLPLRTELEKLEEESVAIRDQILGVIAQLRVESQGLKEKLSVAKEEVNGLLQDAITSQKAWDEEITKLRDEYDRTAKLGAELAAKVTVQKCLEEMQPLRAAIRQFEEDKSRSLGVVRGQEVIIKVHQAREETMKKERAELERNVQENHQATLGKHKEELFSLRNQIQKVQDERSNLANQVDIMKRELSGQTDTLSTAQGELALARVEVKTLSVANGELLVEVDALETNIRSHMDHFEILENERDACITDLRKYARTTAELVQRRQEEDRQLIVILENKVNPERKAKLDAEIKLKSLLESLLNNAKSIEAARRRALLDKETLLEELGELKQRTLQADLQATVGAVKEEATSDREEHPR